MHVVQALVSLGIGGSEMVAVETTEFLRSRGHKVTVIAANGPLKDRIIDSGATFLDWPIGKKRLGTLAYIGRLHDWLKKNPVDILHVHSRLPAWICHLALRKLPADKRPLFITSMHGQYSVSPYSAVMAKGDRVIAVSEHIRHYTMRNYLEKPGERLLTIHGGTSRKDFPFGYQPSEEWYQKTFEEFPELKNKRILLLPGRLSRYKGHATFIELLAALKPEHEDVHGVILGKAKQGSRYINELEGLAERYGVSEQLTFCGSRTDMRDWMSASYLVFNLCSDPPEAFGRIIPEALSLGVPVLGWNHGGVAETLARMFPGGVVDPDNTAELLRKAWEFLQNKPVVEESDAFTLSASMSKTLALYESMLEEKNA